MPGTKTIAALLLLVSLNCDAQSNNALQELGRNIIDTLATQSGCFAVAFKDLETGNSIFMNADTLFHAASTMKTPVLIEAFAAAQAGHWKLTDSIAVVNHFRSIADSSYFSLNPADDSDTSLYLEIGKKATVYNLLELMITRSSNLATNIIIEHLGAANVNARVHALGAKDVQVLRGVEDNKAFQLGLNNVVTARGLFTLFDEMAGGDIGSSATCAEMINILLKQEFNDIIPAGLPAGIKVAHKTGFITGIHHDSGIVFLPDGHKYVLVLLSKNLQNEKTAVAAMAAVSRMIYQFVINNHSAAGSGR